MEIKDKAAIYISMAAFIVAYFGAVFSYEANQIIVGYKITKDTGIIIKNEM